MEGWLTPVELTGMLSYTDDVALLVNAGGTGLSIGKAGSSGAGTIDHCGGIIPVLFHSLPSASNSK